MPDRTPEIDPRPNPEIVPQPEPPQPQPVDPVPPSPQEVPDQGPGVEDPISPIPEQLPPDAPVDRGHHPAPPMPVHLPTSDASDPEGNPVRNNKPDELDYSLPPEPLNDWNP
ncbi:autotransporter family porin [Devosia crocina]|uniref:Autotransporter family porin n=1 Tax=Devosia crocina TaxID=429728 RepID=A0A1I7NBD9_9HYPH|nr:hypothetical protein [Devosia crocina]SFV31985.1 autotransporter family porin [Devosia crocina]